jgi:hypothetical protein
LGRQALVYLALADNQSYVELEAGQTLDNHSDLETGQKIPFFVPGLVTLTEYLRIYNI